MADNGPQLGKLIEGEAGRDAVHIAVAPVTAGEKLLPGERVTIQADGRAIGLPTGSRGVGIVDPYLTAAVEEGQRFYLFLMPGTVTSLRHVWTHPAFKSKLSTEAP